jgi:putative transposase
VEKANHKIATLCRVLQVSTSGFYAWRARPLWCHAQDDAFLGGRDRSDPKRQPGGPTGLPGSTPRSPWDTGSGALGSASPGSWWPTGCEVVGAGDAVVSPVRRAPDLVGRRFDASAPNQLWMTDLTYVPTATGFSYLAAVLDGYSRAVLGWAVGASP